MRDRNAALRNGAAAVVVLTVVTVGVLVGLELAILVMAGAALLLGITLVWSSVQNLTGESPLSLEEALTLGAPSKEEELKRSLLRALKDLEYEKSVGKISPEDYAELSARYRAEAIELMQQLDQNLGPARARAEQLLQERLVTRTKAKQAADEAAARAADDAKDATTADDAPEET